MEVHGYLVISGVTSKVTIVITHIRGPITILITTHEPPSGRLLATFSFVFRFWWPWFLRRGFDSRASLLRGPVVGLFIVAKLKMAVGRVSGFFTDAVKTQRHSNLGLD